MLANQIAEEKRSMEADKAMTSAYFGVLVACFEGNCQHLAFARFFQQMSCLRNSPCRPTGGYVEAVRHIRALEMLAGELLFVFAIPLLNACPRDSKHASF